MKIVLLSGGSGKRLWPLSNDTRSKQFLKLLQTESGQYESMVQRVWGQLTRAGLSECAYVATSQSQIEVIKAQLGTRQPIIVEPERRDTFPAIALAAAYLHSVCEAAPDETVVVLPVDPFVEDRFFVQISKLEHMLEITGADIGLLGVRPTYPSAKYGYIVPRNSPDGGMEYCEAEHFEEKPSEQRAAELISRGALWNCGVFAFRLDYMMQELRSRGLPVVYEQLNERYASLTAISFDYEIVERAERVSVLPYDGSWKDLGTWNTLTEEMGSSRVGKAVLSDDCQAAHVINELEIPVAVLGLSNVIVAASPDGILVADKAASPRIKEVMRHQEQRPMYEERRWGRYRVLDYIQYPDGGQVLTKRILISPDCNLSYQYHRKRQEVWTVVAGRGEIVLAGELRTIERGDVIVVQPNILHSVRAITDLEMIEVQTGEELVEEDIVRLELDWHNIITKYVVSASRRREA
ncbi:sugar phosphate nucleotidyltransferase [Paenibacillus kobensis]|uniref:sugar phosphate nucleotidyltransferase n=1 Tax=Paenibacillus kobensis TaxID=59841 RepID=UPI000FDB6098|nr:sugar phosphate nucleotidyltransferase [Paenibacillus kobensis]